MTEPRADEWVWVSAARSGIAMHRIGKKLTPCGRNCVDYGRKVSAGYAEQRWDALLCAICWPSTVDGESS